MTYTAHVDTFARDNLPPKDQFPEMIFELPELQYPDRLNAAVELLDKAIEKGWGDRIALRGHDFNMTYAQLLAQTNQIARLLLEDVGLVPGNRVLLRGPNNPMAAITWFGVIKAGLIAVATMPMLRQKELSEIVEKAQVTTALCDQRFDQELVNTQQKSPILKEIIYYNTNGSLASLEERMAGKPTTFENIDTAADDVALIAFTSGTTGMPKGTMHFHRDILAICDCFPKSMVGIQADDICIGTPPLAFTFGLGGILLFPLRVGASSLLLEQYTPETMLQTIRDFHVTMTWTSPLFYRRMAELAAKFNISSLRKCISAGEALPAATRTLWREATGIDLIDGIGATEMLHIFISHKAGEGRGGATGKPIPGYHACVLDDEGNPVPTGQPGRLAVKGPTGCRYLADERQQVYVQNGWNFTGDTYLIDEEGYFVYQARSDDMIITAGYNVAGPEIEGVLLMHEAVAECVVVSSPDADRGTVIKAFVVLRQGFAPSDKLVSELQDFVRQTIAPYKYPRKVEFITELPRTGTGKVQRYVLRQKEWEAVTK
jgi:2-aminobenzoate-CoA ligase